jgi:hypothetical protein
MRWQSWLIGSHRTRRSKPTDRNQQSAQPGRAIKLNQSERCQRGGVRCRSSRFASVYSSSSDCRFFNLSDAHHPWKRLVNNVNNGFFDHRRCAALLLTRLDPLRRWTTAGYFGARLGSLFCALGCSTFDGFLAQCGAGLGAFRFRRGTPRSSGHCDPPYGPGFSARRIAAARSIRHQHARL